MNSVSKRSSATCSLERSANAQSPVKRTSCEPGNQAQQGASAQGLLERPVHAIRRAEVREWHRQLAARRAADNRRLTGAADAAKAALEAVYAWLDDDDILGEALPNPTRGVKKLHKGTHPKAFTPEELRVFREAVAIHEFACTRKVQGLRMGHRKLILAYAPTVALQLLDWTGARPVEIRSLRRDQIRFSEAGSVILLDDTKSDEGKVRPLSGPACELLRQHIARVNGESEYLFPGHRSDFMSQGALDGVFDRVLKIAGLASRGTWTTRGFCPNSCRHTMITEGFRRGGTAENISAAAGNSRAVAFEVYRHALPKGAWDVVEQHARRAA